MKGKFQKQSTAKKKKTPGKKWYLIGILAAVLLTLAAIMSAADPEDTAEHPEVTQATGMFTTGPVTETAVYAATEMAEQIHDLGRGIRITKVGKYTGIFMEDATDDVVSDVLMVVVTNTGAEYIQYAQLQLSDGERVANFTLSTLMPGESMVVLESGRMTCGTVPVFTQATLQSIAVFSDIPGMCEDRIQIQCLDGVLNITNISGEDILEDIVVYYKNSAQGIYYGGITYRGRIEGGLRAGEIRQIVAEHFSANGSEIVFVTCG